jgi:hypothetical protein
MRGRGRVLWAQPPVALSLAIQLCLVASKQDSFAICSYCNNHYTLQKTRLLRPDEGISVPNWCSGGNVALLELG